MWVDYSHDVARVYSRYLPYIGACKAVSKQRDYVNVKESQPFPDVCRFSASTPNAMSCSRCRWKRAIPRGLVVHTRYVIVSDSVVDSSDVSIIIARAPILYECSIAPGRELMEDRPSENIVALHPISRVRPPHSLLEHIADNDHAGSTHGNPNSRCRTNCCRSVYYGASIRRRRHDYSDFALGTTGCVEITLRR